MAEEDDIGQQPRRPRSKKPWVELWTNNSGSSASLDEYLATLPSTVVSRTTPRRVASITFQMALMTAC
ncbi:hypothetical protein GN958_ATG09736 [Phytophthora infestans]|uniref:Uncharacterized protein n=1 Tax=Phytophthora infestans TaxID=4787 RepID=A0A8S9URJ2_PHYIN|nr:hypothetical protein GN958_ATG09736 [Phytophthora infestans]